MIVVRALFVTVLFIPIWLTYYRYLGLRKCWEDAITFVRNGPDT